MTRNALIIPMALITLVFGFQVAEMCSSKPRPSLEFRVYSLGFNGFRI